MILLADCQQMKAVDDYSIHTLKIPSLVLMERAALAVAEHIGRQQPANARILAVCGSGNNGGDGLAIARILHTKGFLVDWYMAGNLEKATQETRLQMEIIENMAKAGGLSQCRDLQAFSDYDVIVDGLFGIGLSRVVEGSYAQVIEAVNSSGAFVYAVDIPSGISTDTGAVLCCAVKADVTVTFGCHKLGLALYPGAEFGGRVYVEDIGFPKISVENAHIDVMALEKSDISNKLPRRRAYSNKGSYGRTLVIAGSEGMPGACCLCAQAAYRTGCGLVRVLTAKENREILMNHVPEAVMTVYESFGPTLALLQECLDWADSVVIGPGLTTGEHARTMLEYTVRHCSVPLVIDADGLNLLAQDAAGFVTDCQSFLEGLSCPVIVTPHLGEMARLTGRSISQIAGDLCKTCQTFAQENPGLVCVLKDARTVISDGVSTYINLSGNSGMATGGSGDVLSGILGGLLAMGMPALDGAALGCLIHGCAGDRAAADKGPYTMLASDIIQYMTEILC